MLLSRCRRCGTAVQIAIIIALISPTLQENRRNADQSHQPQQRRGHRGGTKPRDEQHDGRHGGIPVRPSRHAKSPHRSDKPNIVFVITDDQDVELGSLNFMPKTARAVRDQGATFVNAFVTTPMCCPSRSSMLTGMYVHNHNVYTNNDNCSSEQWRQTHETHNFGTYLSNAGYRTGFFGKYLNEYTGSYIPPGWTEWLGLIRNTRFYNYTLNYNGQKIKHEDNYAKDYLTDVIANDSARFLRESKRFYPNRPVAMVLSMPAPHGPEDAAPQYQNLFMDVKSHRTPSWNFAPNPDKQWLLQYTGKMSPIQIAFTDVLQTKRLQTLQSVDDAVEKVVQVLEDLDELDNTYIIYTSDHGYHLGQYGLVKGKAMPYEFDIRVPFYMRGPRIAPGTRISGVVLNLDIAPTLLDIAGIPTPDHMDGSSVLKLLEDQSDYQSNVRKRRTWRDTFLVERGKLTLRKLKVQEKLEAHFNRLVTTKEQRLEEECEKPHYQPPCKLGQEWECRRNEHGKLRVYKCRPDNRTAVSQLPTSKRLVRCNCQHQNGNTGVDREMDAEEIQRQLDFLQHHVNQPRMVEPRFISERVRRDIRKGHKIHRASSTVNPAVNDLDRGNDGNNATELDQRNEASKDLDQARVMAPEIQWIPVKTGDDDVQIPCRLTFNGTVVCERYVYSNTDEWLKQKTKIEGVINDYRHRVSVLENIQRHLIETEPTTIQPDRGTLQDTLFFTSTESVPAHKMFNVTSDEFISVHEIEDESEDEDSDSEEDHETLSTADESVCWCEEDETPSHRSGKLRIHKIRKGNSKLEMLARDVASQEERDNLRRQKMEQNRLSKVHTASGRRQRNRKSNKLHKTQSVHDCNTPDASCSEGFTPPTTLGVVRQSSNPWDGMDLSHYNSRRDPVCHIDGLECSRMDDEHWKTAPFWTRGPFCICPNSNNNTYWCLRTVNDTHNFLYCEFITGFISFYDMTRDPYQLRNAVHDLSFGILHQLHDRLELMKGCKGSRKCNLRSRVSSADGDDQRDTFKNERLDIKVTKVNGQSADTTRSKWMPTKGV